MGTLLGDLPPVSNVTSPKKEKGRKIKIRRNVMSDCPEEFKCAIDGKILTHPLKSPYGHVFERKTLEAWASTCGSVCPVTGDVLQIEQCTLDKDLQKRIVRWVKETMPTMSA